MSFDDRDPDLDPDYYSKRARKTYSAVGHLPDPGKAVGHAVGHNHPESSVESEEGSRSNQHRQRAFVLRYLYDAGTRGTTVWECEKEHPDLFKGSPNEASIPFGWARAGGWARRVLHPHPQPRPVQADEKVRASGKVVRPTGPRSTACVQIMTRAGRADYEQRFLDQE